jgi:hypothetical protein
MARDTRFHHPLQTIRQQWPTPDEWRDYRLLSKEVLLVIASFVALCLMMALVFELPMLIQ